MRNHHPAHNGQFVRLIRHAYVPLCAGRRWGLVADLVAAAPWWRVTWHALRSGLVTPYTSANYGDCVQTEPLPIEQFDSVRLHIVVRSAEAALPSSVRILDAAVVTWAAPEDWSTKIMEVLSTPGAAEADVPVVSSIDDGRVLDIVAHTSHRGAQVILDEHRLVSMLEEWTTQPKVSFRSTEHISREEAEAAVWFALQFHFAITRDKIDTMDGTYEPGDEYLMNLSIGSERYVATLKARGAVHLSHVVNRTDL